MTMANANDAEPVKGNASNGQADEEEDERVGDECDKFP